MVRQAAVVQGRPVASIVVSYGVALQFRDPVAQMIKADPPWNIFLAMLILYIVTAAGVWIGFNMVRGIINRLKLKEWDAHLGAFMGLAKGALICLLVTFFAVSLLGETKRQQIIHSRSGYAIAVALHNAPAVIPDELDKLVTPYLEDFGEKLARPLEDTR